MAGSTVYGLVQKHWRSGNDSAFDANFERVSDELCFLIFVFISDVILTKEDYIM